MRSRSILDSKIMLRPCRLGMTGNLGFCHSSELNGEHGIPHCQRLRSFITITGDVG